jgi:hypothetical protein
MQVLDQLAQPIIMALSCLLGFVSCFIFAHDLKHSDIQIPEL